MMLLSFFGHAAVWESWRHQPNLRIPSGVAVPWYFVAQRLGRPPVLAYASHALCNWRRIEANGPIELGNLTTLQQFLGGLDEEWFILLHVAIEAVAAPALAAFFAAQRAVASNAMDELVRQLVRVLRAQEAMFATLLRMTENCDPHIFFTRIQPFLHGFQQAPVVYEGVEAYGGRPQSFAGASAAQSLLLPVFDAAMGIEHQRDELAAYLEQLHGHAPPEHRAFRDAIAAGPSIRAYVIDHLRQEPAIRTAYNTCVAALARFRAKHLEYTNLYLEAPARRSAQAGPEHGTGGTPFMRFLEKYAKETEAHLL
jgi:indoleamine 2,3-dioxygenase